VQSGVDLKAAKLSMNPFCEIAVEEALRIREAGLASEVVAVSVGGTDQEVSLHCVPETDREVLPHCLYLTELRQRLAVCHDLSQVTRIVCPPLLCC
jgi:hypothetical protein